MEKSSRTLHLESQLTTLGFDKSLKAFDLVIEHMSAEKGKKRHNGVHYYYHLIDVTQLLLNFGMRDDELLSAALLHDFVEDVPWATIEYVEEVFGPRVAKIVGKVTKKKGVDYKADLNEMNEYISAIEEDLDSCIIKTADRINNFSTMKHSSISHRERQVKETKEIYIPFFKRCREKYVRNANFFFFAKTTIEPILCEIERNIELTKMLNK